MSIKTISKKQMSKNSPGADRNDVWLGGDWLEGDNILVTWLDKPWEVKSSVFCDVGVTGDEVGLSGERAGNAQICASGNCEGVLRIVGLGGETIELFNDWMGVGEVTNKLDAELFGVVGFETGDIVGVVGISYFCICKI